MERRRFLVSSGVALGALSSFAGCTGSSEGSAPPRKSNVFDDVSVTGERIVASFQRQPTLTSRADIQGGQDNNQIAPPGGDLGGLNPVGKAQAKGRGAAARGRSAGSRGSVPRTSNGWFIYYGGAYGAWYDDHDDEVQRYSANIVSAASARLANANAKEQKLPGVGPVEWDTRQRNPGSQFSVPLEQPGWYRVGTHLKSRNGNHDFGWEAVDMQVKSGGSGYTVGDTWKMSPRL